MPAYTPIYRCTLVREGSVATAPRLNCVEKACAVASSYLADALCEQLIVILLDTKRGVIGVVPITQGTLDSSLVHPREVLRPAIIHNAASFIVAHNHPSGDCTPSREDETVCTPLLRAAEQVGVEIADFIIVSGTGATLSMRSDGYCGWGRL